MFRAQADVDCGQLPPQECPVSALFLAPFLTPLWYPQVLLQVAAAAACPFLCFPLFAKLVCSFHLHLRYPYS